MMGFLLLLVFCTVVPLGILRAGFTVKRLLLDLLGVMLFGKLLALPGAWLWAAGAVTAATGSGQSDAIALGKVVLPLGILLGQWMGLYAAERLQKQITRPRAGDALAATAGFAVSVGVCLAGLALAQNDATFELPFLVLVIPAGALGTVGGYAIGARRRLGRAKRYNG